MAVTVGAITKGGFRDIRVDVAVTIGAITKGGFGMLGLMSL